MPKRSSRGSRRRTIDNANKEILKRIEENTRVELEKSAPEVPDKVPLLLSIKKIVTFKRTGLGPAVSTSTSGSSFGATFFTLALFDTGAEIKAMFQEYRIIELEIKFVPTTRVASNGTPSINTGNFHTVIDYHNANVPISFAELDEYKSLQVVQTGLYVTRTFSPRTLFLVYGGVTPAYCTQTCMRWMSTDYNDAEYYGIKWGLGANVGLGNIQIYSMQVSAVIQCRSPM